MCVCVFLKKKSMSSFFSFLVDVGLDTPLRRAIFGAALGFIPVVLKSSLFYNSIQIQTEEESYSTKVAKVFSPLASPGTDPSQTTLFPWYFLPLLLATIFGLFL